MDMAKAGKLTTGILLGSMAANLFLRRPAGINPLAKEGIELHIRLLDAKQRRVNCEAELLAMDMEELAAEDEKKRDAEIEKRKEKRAALGLDKEEGSKEDAGKDFINDIISAVLPVLQDHLLAADPEKLPPFISKILEGFAAPAAPLSPDESLQKQVDENHRGLRKRFEEKYPGEYEKIMKIPSEQDTKKQIKKIMEEQKKGKQNVKADGD